MNKIFTSLYLDNIKNQQIFILGFLPPPIGGVSIHIKRAINLLEKQLNVVKLFDVIKESQKYNRFIYSFILIQKLLKFNPHIIFYHTLFLRKNLIELLLLIIFKILFRSQLIIIEHSDRFFSKRSFFYIKGFNFLSFFIDKHIFIGKGNYNKFLICGFRSKKFLIDSPFLEPNINNEDDLWKRYPIALKNFCIDKKIILMNASKFGLWDNRDIYGFDFCIRLMEDIRSYDIGLIMAVGTIGDEHCYNQVIKVINKYKIFVFVNHSDLELWPLIKKATLFVRPTRFDTFGISVAEALYFNIPAIASNVCDRIDGTLLFENENYEDFKKQVFQQLNLKRNKKK